MIRIIDSKVVVHKVINDQRGPPRGRDRREQVAAVAVAVAVAAPFHAYQGTITFIDGKVHIQSFPSPNAYTHAQTHTLSRTPSMIISSQVCPRKRLAVDPLRKFHTRGINRPRHSLGETKGDRQENQMG